MSVWSERTTGEKVWFWLVCLVLVPLLIAAVFFPFVNNGNFRPGVWDNFKLYFGMAIFFSLPAMFAAVFLRFSLARSRAQNFIRIWFHSFLGCCFGAFFFVLYIRAGDPFFAKGSFWRSYLIGVLFSIPGSLIPASILTLLADRLGLAWMFASNAGPAEKKSHD